MFLDCSEIIPGRLWVGSYVREGDIFHLQQFGITTVISLQSDEDFASYGISGEKLSRAFESAGIHFRRLPILDFDREALARGLSEAVVELAAEVAKPWTRVYLHCTAGINRAPTVAAAYLIRSRGLSAAVAVAYLTSRRHCSPSLDILERFATDA